MTTKETVLSMLEANRGTPLSGAKMAAHTGLSRTAIWKAIEELRRDGYEISAVTREGYTLSSNSDVLSESCLRSFVKTKNLSFILYKSTESTNVCVKELAASGAPEGTVVLSEMQTAGRGRSEKSFFSPAGTGLYMSILLRPKMSAADALQITTCAAVAVAQAAEAAANRPAKIKWVNDVYMDNKKICGILTEGSFNLESGGLEYAVLGIGVNMTPPPNGFPPSIQQIAGALFDTKPTHDIRCKIAADILDRFFTLYRANEKGAQLAEYRRRSLLTGQEIFVLRGSECLAATALGIDDDFCLHVRYTDGNEAHLSSGEVSIKPMLTV